MEENGFRNRFQPDADRTAPVENKVLTDILSSLKSLEKIVLRVEDKLGAPTVQGESLRKLSKVAISDLAPSVRPSVRSELGVPSLPIPSAGALAVPQDQAAFTSRSQEGSDSPIAGGSEAIKDLVQGNTERTLGRDSTGSANNGTAIVSVPSQSSPRMVLRRHRGRVSDVFAGTSRRGSRNSTKSSASGSVAEPTRSRKNIFGHHRSKLVDSQWPASLQMRSGMQTQVSEHKASLMSLGLHFGRSYSSEGFMRPQNLLVTMHASRHRCFPLGPDTWLCTTLQWVRLVLLLYETFLNPVTLAWNLHPQGAHLVLEVIVAACFLIDCPLRFITGFYHDGEFVGTYKRIALHYARRWLGPDMFLIAIDWLVLFGATLQRQGTNNDTLLALLDVIFVLRLCKLIRMVKAVMLFRTLASGFYLFGLSISAESAPTLMIPFALVIYNHLVCCLWGWIVRVERRKGSSWLDAALVQDEPVASQYLASLHWTVAQMTPGPINIVASTDLERSVNCIILLCGLLYGSIIISQFSGQIMQWSMLRRGKMQKLDSARLFLKQRDVRRALSIRIQTQVRKRIFEDAPLQLHQVQAFDLLAYSLRMELLLEMRLPPLLSSHMLFRVWWSAGPPEVASLCADAMDVAVLMPQDELFQAGKPGNQAYLMLKGGLLTYMQEPSSSMVSEQEEEPVAEGQWFCEAALWSMWTHVGTLLGPENDPSELLVLHAEGLIRELNKEESSSRIMVLHYGRQFYTRLVTAMPPFTPWPNDLQVPETDVGSLIGMGVGMGLLTSAIDQNIIHLSDDAQEMLMQELAEEKCTLRSLADGSLERTVAVVALRLLNNDDLVLVQLAKCDFGKELAVNCALPGIKRGASELHEKAFERLLQKRLPGLSGSVVVDNTKFEVKHSHSQAFGGMPTIYQRYEILAFLEGAEPREAWRVLNIGQEGQWLGVTELFRVDDDKGFYVFAWLESVMFDELLDSDARRGALESWLAHFDFEDAQFDDPLEAFFNDGVVV